MTIDIPVSEQQHIESTIRGLQFLIDGGKGESVTTADIHVAELAIEQLRELSRLRTAQPKGESGVTELKRERDFLQRLCAIRGTALERIAAIENKPTGHDWDEIEEARQIAIDGLRSPAACAASQETAPSLLREIEALERAAYANESMARICHGTGKAYETQQHLHDAATLRSLAKRLGEK